MMGHLNNVIWENWMKWKISNLLKKCVHTVTKASVNSVNSEICLEKLQGPSCMPHYSISLGLFSDV